MKLFIEHPPAFQSERAYILAVLLEDFLGLNIQLKKLERVDVRITASDGKELFLADELFSIASDKWLRPSSLPQKPLKTWDVLTSTLRANLLNPQVPIIYGKDPKSPGFFKTTDKRIDLGLDIFGSCFFMLTRYEELVKTNGEQQARFPAAASLAFQEDFLDRPIVNEYLEILWACLKQLWPELHRKKRHYALSLSHDVDQLFHIAGRPLLRAMRRLGGDIFKRRDAELALRSGAAYIRSLRGSLDDDPCNTFDFIMDISEKHGLKSTFYFMTDLTSPGDGDRGYQVNTRWLAALMKHIHQRGHEIGLHLNINSYLDVKQTKIEFDDLIDLTSKEGIRQKTWGGRQHYLKWNNPITWQNLEDAGLAYDSTLIYFDRVGFRCGTCYEYPIFNLRTKRRLNLNERPLIIMDGAFHYMKKSWMDNSAKKSIRDLSGSCKHYNGSCSLLWHNSSLVTPREKNEYNNILESIF